MWNECNEHSAAIIPQLDVPFCSVLNAGFWTTLGFSLSLNSELFLPPILSDHLRRAKIEINGDIKIIANKLQFFNYLRFKPIW